jgi:hypothetical protein
MWKIFWSILFDERGEDAPEGGQGDAPVNDGQGKAPEPEGEAKTPKYGEFGDAPTVDQLFEAFQGKTKEFEKLNGTITDYKGKLTATQRNIAAIREALEGSGLKVLQDDSGKISLTVAEKAQKREPKFSRDHEKLFEPPVLEAIKNLIEDVLGSRLEDYDKGVEGKFDNFYKSRRESIVKYNKEKVSSNQKLRTLFPQLMENKSDGTANPDFNKDLYELATEIWEGNETLKKSPRGELDAVIEAAVQLGIAPSSAQALEKAKKDGYVEGKTSKKILGPVNTKAQKSSGQGKKLSREEYDKLSDDKKREHDAEQIGVKA